MNAQQAENLRILIRHMETKVSRILNMARYHACGTPACAIGEAAAMPHFQSLGLYNVRGEDLDYCGYSGHARAATELFGLSENQRSSLFGSDFFNAWGRNDVNPKEWAIEARKVLAECGYSMDAVPDAFPAFMAKVMEPVAVTA